MTGVPSLKQSEFNVIVKEGKEKVIPKFEKGTNIVKFIKFVPADNDNKKTGSLKIVHTDMIRDIHVSVRLIMNVQLFSYEKLLELKDESRGLVDEFIKENNATSLTGISIEDMGNITKSGVCIPNWLIVEFPFIQSALVSVNEYTNKIVSAYHKHCDELDITGDENFIIAKMVADVQNVEHNDHFSMYMSNNYQKPNANLNNVTVMFNIPKGGKTSWILVPSNPKGYRYSFTGQRNHEKIAFDDRVKILETVVQRFVYKTEDTVFAHFASRTINIYKKNKNAPLISKDSDGNIKLNEIEFEIKENAKAIGDLRDNVEAFTLGSKLIMRKDGRDFINLVDSMMCERTVEDIIK